MDTYGSRGLKVLAFPCNQFAAEEPVYIAPIVILNPVSLFALNANFRVDEWISLIILTLAC